MKDNLNLDSTIIGSMNTSNMFISLHTSTMDKSLFEMLHLLSAKKKEMKIWFNKRIKFVSMFISIFPFEIQLSRGEG